MDPLVRVEIHGVPMDQAKQETRYIENNGAEKAVGLYTSEHIVTTGHPKYYAVSCSRIKDYPQTDRGVHSIVHTQGWDVDPAGGNNEWMHRTGHFALIDSYVSEGHRTLILKDLSFLQDSTLCGTTLCASPSTLPNWPWFDLWWKTMTRHLRTTLWGSIRSPSAACSKVSLLSLPCMHCQMIGSFCSHFH